MKIQQLFEQNKPRKCVYVELQGRYDRDKDIHTHELGKVQHTDSILALRRHYFARYFNEDFEYTRNNIDEALRDYSQYLQWDDYKDDERIKQFKRYAKYATTIIAYYTLVPYHDRGDKMKAEELWDGILVAVIRQ